MENNTQSFIYTDEQLMARLKFFVGVCLALTLAGIVFVVLYSIIFVTQPLNAISPIDQKFFELIIPIATFLTGTLSGIMLAGTKKEDQDAMLAAQKNAQTAFDSAKTKLPPASSSVTISNGQGQSYSFSDQGGQVVVGFGGKMAPPPAHQPEL